jgi:hypothetical protein
MTKERRLEEDISKIPEPSLSEPSETSTTTANPQSDVQHAGDTTPPETSTVDSQKTFQKDFKHDENTDTTETDTDAVKESMVNLEEVKKDERNDDPEQQNPSEDDDSDEDYTGDCFDGWAEAWGSDRSQSLHGSSDEDIVFSTSNGTLSRRELRKIEEEAERVSELDNWTGAELPEHHSDDSDW